MSTRSHVWFKDEYTKAGVYVHCDGYPGNPDGSEWGRLVELRDFFKRCAKDNEESWYGDRFNDPEYLAARFIVYYTQTNDRRKGLMDFGGVGVCNELHGDLEYVYTVDCSKHDENGFPTVTYEEV